MLRLACAVALLVAGARARGVPRGLAARGGSARAVDPGDLSRGRLGRARALADAEQAVEDYNAAQKFAGSFHRRMIVIPLNEQFDVPAGQFGHGKMEEGDKVSVPRSIMVELQKRNLEARAEREPRERESARARALARASLSPPDAETGARPPPSWSSLSL